MLEKDVIVTVRTLQGHASREKAQHFLWQDWQTSLMGWWEEEQTRRQVARYRFQPVRGVQI